MKLREDIFKSYDIRGVYPDEFDQQAMKVIGRAYAEYLKGETGKDSLELVVSHDMRDSSQLLKKAVIEGITMQGVDVVEIGLASTPTFYFAVSHFGYDGGINITASHNPEKYNGAKLVKDQARPIGLGSGLEQIRDIALEQNFSDVKTKGEVTKKEGVLKEQVDFALDFTEAENIKPYKVVVDTGNGMGAPLMGELFKSLPCELDKMYFELDGSFPNHEANPLIEENNEDIRERIQTTDADLGIATDGDADRIFFFDENGDTVEPAIIRGIMAKLFLADNPGAPICYDVRPGEITVDMIEQYGGEPIVTRVGHSHIKKEAREVGAPFAGESSGHFFVDTGNGIYETPEIIAIMLLEELSKSGKTMSEYVEPMREKYAHSGEINFLVDDKDAVFDRLRDEYGENDIKYDFDGLTFEWNDWWFNVRKSSTTDKVRLNLEAENEEIMKEKVKEVSEIIENN
ncbi:MAG: phosphomannomutase/phosphoglucomutase [Candidatus Paceibacteria bacterium]